jgi:hypothetical protein
VIDLVPHDGGVLLRVRAQPGARRSAVRGAHHGALKLAVTQIAEKGKANRAITELLSETLNVNKSQLTLLAGHTAANKTFLVRGITLAELQRRIEAIIPH